MSKAIDFPGRNVIFAEDQPEYNPLPAIRMPDGEGITCWELRKEEVDIILNTRRIYLRQSTFNQPLQPVSITADLSDNIQLT